MLQVALILALALAFALRGWVKLPLSLAAMAGSWGISLLANPSAVRLTGRALGSAAEALAASPGVTALIMGLGVASWALVAPLLVFAGRWRLCFCRDRWPVHAWPAAVRSHGFSGSSRRDPVLQQGQAPHPAPCRRLCVAFPPPCPGFALSNGTLGPNPTRGGSPDCVAPHPGGHCVPCCVWETSPWAWGYVALAIITALWAAAVAAWAGLYTVAAAAAQGWVTGALLQRPAPWPSCHVH